MKRAALLAIVVPLAGCPICPGSEMRILDGNSEGVVLPGDLVQLEARYGDWRAGPGHCGEHWYVNRVEGGTAELGRIDDCGLYRAPASFPMGLHAIEIEASEYPPDGCLDCCPYAFIALTPVS